MNGEVEECLDSRFSNDPAAERVAAVVEPARLPRVGCEEAIGRLGAGTVPGWGALLAISPAGAGGTLVVLGAGCDIPFGVLDILSCLMIVQQS